MAAPTGMIGLTAIADETTSEVAAGNYLLLLADRNALPAHPALMYQGSINGMGSTTKKVPHLGLLGYDIPGTATEGDPAANTSLTDASSTITTVQKTKVYEPSDIAKMIDAQGFLSPEFLALDAVVTGAVLMTSMVANVIDDFTAYVGVSGVDASISDFLDMITTLEIAKVQGPYLFAGHPVQWGDIRKDVVTASGGAIQWNPGSQALIDAMKGIGYQGIYFGVDCFTTAHTPTANAGADRAGGMWGQGGVLWMDGEPPLEDPVNQMLLQGKVLFERGRVVAGGTTKYAQHRYLGVAIGINACGVSLITDA